VDTTHHVVYLCYNLFLRCDSSAPFAATAFTNWFCKDYMVLIFAREQFFTVHRMDNRPFQWILMFLVSFHSLLLLTIVFANFGYFWVVFLLSLAIKLFEIWQHWKRRNLTEKWQRTRQRCRNRTRVCDWNYFLRVCQVFGSWEQSFKLQHQQTTVKKLELACCISEVRLWSQGSRRRWNNQPSRKPTCDNPLEPAHESRSLRCSTKTFT